MTFPDRSQPLRFLSPKEGSGGKGESRRKKPQVPKLTGMPGQDSLSQGGSANRPPFFPTRGTGEPVIPDDFLHPRPSGSSQPQEGIIIPEKPQGKSWLGGTREIGTMKQAYETREQYIQRLKERGKDPADFLKDYDPSTE